MSAPTGHNELPLSPRGWGQTWVALVAYAGLVSVLAYCQRGYFNSDFVAYATLARKLLAHPAASIAGHWSPLFSWCMAPLMKLGVSDLVAGRLVLMAAGAGYVSAVLVLSRRLAPATQPGRIFFLGAVSCCSVLEAGIWASYLLDPDLLATTLVLACLVFLSHPQLAAKGWRCFAAGLLAGSAYLAKAYMMPFLLALMFPLWFVLARLRTTDPPLPSEPQIRLGLGAWLRGLARFVLGLALVATPWVVILSTHYSRFTITTVGSNAHADVGPLHYGQDPLWNPPLGANFICDPHFGPDWSPLESWPNFRHQLYLVYVNSRNGLGHVAGWLALLGAGIGVLGWSNGPRRAVSLLPRDRWVVVLLLGTAGLYFFGYTPAMLEARYIIPMLAPLLCMLGMTLVCAGFTYRPFRAFTGLEPRRAGCLGALLILLFAAQDLYRIRAIVFQHSQSASLTYYRQIAEELRPLGVCAAPFAASDWHTGLNLAYAADAIPLYLGRPRAQTPADRAVELQAANVRTYLHFLPHPTSTDTLVLPPPWKRVKTFAPAANKQVDVYVLPDGP